MSESVVLNQPAGIFDPTPGLGEEPELLHCIQCGSCSGVCPFGYLMEYPPSRMISALRAGIFNKVIHTESAWMCIACFACTTVCPTLIPITEILMTKAKEEMILAGNIPEELQNALEASHRYGNSLGESPRKRATWIESAGVEIPILGKEIKEVDVLWYVGDYPSYHSSVIPSTIAFAHILSALGVKFGILGKDEKSDGDSQRLAGEKGLFEDLAENNGKAFSKYKFNEIITTDPHAFNAFKNEYPKLGIEYPVRHYTQFLVDKIDQLKPLLKKEVKARVTFHDPCYLGRVNNVYEEPRALLEIIPGVELVEMEHNRENSICCGGGGGGMWMDGFLWSKAQTRTSEWRIREAIHVRANIMATACPYEIPRFDDARKSITGEAWELFGLEEHPGQSKLDKAVEIVKLAEQMKIKDITELIFEAF